MIVITIDEEMKGEKILALKNAVLKIAPSATINTEAFAKVIWSKADVKEQIVDMGVISDEITEKAITNLTCLNNCTDEDWDTIDNAIDDAVDSMMESDWNKTDDLQYEKNIGHGVYRFAEARCSEDDEHIVCAGQIDVADWFSKDGKYNSDCKKIIEVYYSSVQNFEENYPDTEFREQVLAEMLFEEKPYYDTDKYEIVSEDKVDKAVKMYVIWADRYIE